MFGSDFKQQNFRRKKREEGAHVGRERLEHHQRRLANRGRAHRERFDQRISSGELPGSSSSISNDSIEEHPAMALTVSRVPEKPALSPEAEMPRQVLPEGIGGILNIVA